MLGITQEQMCNGVVSEPFYSRVENDQKNIKMNDLIKILNNHQVSLADFFNVFDNNSFQEKLIQAFNHKNATEISYLVKKTQGKEKRRAKLMLASLKGTISQTTRIKNIKKELLEKKRWNKNTLLSVNILLPVFSENELSQILNSINAELNQITQNDSQTLIYIANIITAYAKYCYQTEKSNEIEKAVCLMDKLPVVPEIIFQILELNFYNSLIKNNLKKADEISNLFKMTGYQL